MVVEVVFVIHTYAPVTVFGLPCRSQRPLPQMIAVYVGYLTHLIGVVGVTSAGGEYDFNHILYAMWKFNHLAFAGGGAVAVQRATELSTHLKSAFHY